MANSHPTHASLQDLTAAYRLFLGRDADAEGIAHYSQAIASGMTLDKLRDEFMWSDEYRAKHAPRLLSVDIGDGVIVSIDPTDSEFGEAIADGGTWEPHIIDRIVGGLNPGDTYIDVGGNVGVMALRAARVVGPSGSVIAFEPNPDNAARFIEGVAANGFGNVVLHQFALSNKQSIIAIGGKSNSYVTASPTGRLVQAIVGDDLLQSVSRVDFIKLDIEGFEPFALAGLMATLRSHRPNVLCEFNPRCLKLHGLEPHQFAEALFKMATEIVAIEHDGSEHVVKNGGELMDLWNGKNIEAVSDKRLPDGMLHFDLFFRFAGSGV